MVRVCKENRISVLEQVRNGKLDSAMLSSTNLIDEIILAMHDNHLLSKISESIPDLRAPNTVIPYDVVWASAIAAKMKVHTSLSDIPFAISDHRTLAKLGYALVDTDDGIQEYEGEVVVNNTKYEFEINAQTGEITNWEQD